MKIVRKPMKNLHRTIGVTIVSVALVLTTGCVNPNGTQNNTGTGALIGAMTGALVGGLTGGRNAGVSALIGAGVGAIAGAIAGHVMDHINAQQKAQLQEQSPQTLQTIQHNDQIVQQQQQATATPASGQPAPPAEAPTPITLDDIKMLSSAGVKVDVIKEEIGESKAIYSPADIVAAQQANVDPSVIECMKSHAG